MTRRQRGQVIPIFAAVLAVFVLVAVFFFNVIMFQTSAAGAMRSSLRAAGLAAVQQVDPSVDDLGRWYVDPAAATSVARDYTLANLTSETAGGAGGSEWLFADLTVISSSTGTSDATIDGLDVEVINPAAQPGQVSTRHLNGAATGVSDCGDGSYPTGVVSQLSGECYHDSTVVLRLRLSAMQAVGDPTTLTQVVASRAGTDD